MACNTKISTQSFANCSDIVVDNTCHRDEKLPPLNDYKESSKKRKHELTENDVFTLTDGTSNHMSSHLSLTFHLFKNSDAKSKKIKCEQNRGNLCVNINEGASFEKSSKPTNGEKKWLYIYTTKKTSAEILDVN